MRRLGARGAVFLALALGVGSGPARAEAPEAPPELVDLNAATVEELAKLPGIGKTRADAIVARRTRRPFTRVHQLLEVKGIGRRTFARLRTQVTVARPTAPRSAPVLSPSRRTVASGFGAPSRQTTQPP